MTAKLINEFKKLGVEMKYWDKLISLHNLYPANELNGELSKLKLDRLEMEYVKNLSDEFELLPKVRFVVTDDSYQSGMNHI
jgi:hypothetical protein